MKNIDLLNSYIDVFSKGDLEAAASFLADDILVVEADSMPYAGEWKGKQGFFQLIETVFSLWSDMNIAVTDIIGDPDGDTFAVVMDMEGISVRNGRSFSTALCEIWTIRGGKLAMVRPFYWDTKLMSELAAG